SEAYHMETAPRSLYSVSVRSLAFQTAYGIILALVVVSVLQPDLRGWLRSHLRTPSRKVLSTVVGDLRGDGSRIKVVKIRGETLLLEFYATSENGESQLLQRIPLEDRHDAFFDYNGEASNLLLTDIKDADGEGRKEVIVPSSDTEMRAHLNI